jgi:hypothetical protein
MISLTDIILQIFFLFSNRRSASADPPSTKTMSSFIQPQSLTTSAPVSMVIAVRIKPVDAGQRDGFEEGKGAVTRDGPEGRVLIEMTTELGTAGGSGALSEDGLTPVASSSTSSGRTSTKAFAPEHVFMPSSSQSEVYESCAREVVMGILQGVNGAIIAYGQTGSGKTHTMLGDPSSATQQGIIPRAVTDLFAGIDALRARELAKPGVLSVQADVRASYVEIYQELPYDLLANTCGTGSLSSTSGGGQRGAFGSSSGMNGGGDESRKLLRIREDADDGFFLEDLTRVSLTSPKQSMEVLQNGFNLRRTASTAMNARSSRSHAVLSLSVDVKVNLRDSDNIERTTTRSALLDIVDLAGSERQRDTGAEGSTVKEAGKINNSLGCLADVVKTTVDNQLARHSKMSKPVPWRNSRLTMLLKRSLSGNSKTVMIFAISPALEYWAESNNTLLFADRARRLKTEPSSNERTVLMGGTNVQVAQMAKEIAALKAQLARVRSSNGASADLLAASAPVAPQPIISSLTPLCDLGSSLAMFATPDAIDFTSTDDLSSQVVDSEIERQIQALNDFSRVLKEVDTRCFVTATALREQPNTSSDTLNRLGMRVTELEREGVSNGLAHAAAVLTSRVATLEATIAAGKEEQRCAHSRSSDIVALSSSNAVPVNEDLFRTAFSSVDEDDHPYGRLSSEGSMFDLGGEEHEHARVHSLAPSAPLQALEHRLNAWRATAAAELAAPMTEVLMEAGRKDAVLSEYKSFLSSITEKNDSVDRLVSSLHEALDALHSGVSGIGVIGAAINVISALSSERHRLLLLNAQLEAKLRGDLEGGGGGVEMPKQIVSSRTYPEVLPRQPRLASRAGLTATSSSAAVPILLHTITSAASIDETATTEMLILPPSDVSDPMRRDISGALSPLDDVYERSTMQPPRLTAQTLVEGTVPLGSERGGSAGFLRPFMKGATESLRQAKPRVSSAQPTEIVAALARARNMSISSNANAPLSVPQNITSDLEEDQYDETYDRENAFRIPASARHSMMSVAESTASVGTSISGRMEASEWNQNSVAAVEGTLGPSVSHALEPVIASANVPIAEPAAAPVVVKRPLASLIARAKAK